MSPEEVERLIEANVDDADATVTLPRVHDDEEEDAHYAAVVVSPAFEGKSLVQQHQLVYDALDGHMTTDIHALEIKTFTPEEYADRDD